MPKKLKSEVEIEEYYRKEDGIVKRFWRYGWEKDWRVDNTILKEEPYIYWRQTKKS